MSNERINWDIFTCDLKHRAAVMAFEDPEYKKRVKPLNDMENAMINHYEDLKKQIFKEYEDKYFEQLTAEYDTQVALVKAAMEKIKAEDPNV